MASREAGSALTPLESDYLRLSPEELEAGYSTVVSKKRRSVALTSDGGLKALWQHHFGSWWHFTYLVDWLLLVLYVAIEVPLAAFVFSPYDRYLPPNDAQFAYPLMDDTVPTYAVGILLLLPVLIFGVFQVLNRSMHDFHHAMLGLCEAVIFTLIFTDAIKIACGRYRPDWYARADQSASVIRDGRQSFPSGHSSMSFTGMTYLSLYLCGKFGLFRHNGGTVFKATIAMLPLAISAAIAVSRTRDYHHDFSDILAGTVLGVMMAVFAYFLNYPSLLVGNCYVPKSRAGWRLLYYGDNEGEYDELADAL